MERRGEPEQMQSPAMAKSRRASPAAFPGEPVQVRGILPEKIVISTVLDPYLSIKALATYSGLSVRTLRTHLDRPPAEALPCYRVGGKILIRRSEFDGWIKQFESRGRPSLAQAIKEMGLFDQINEHVVTKTGGQL